jgi:hypothetical protein
MDGMTKPMRQRKDDRLIHSGAKPEEIACDTATGPFDRLCREMDRKWGQDRLPELVSPETAARWGQAMANLNAAINATDPEMVVARVNACLRGFAKMDAEATAAGHQPIPPQAQEIEVDGKLCAVLWDASAWPVYQTIRPGVRTYTPLEVANALAAYGKTVAAIKDQWPGAEVTAVRTPTPLEAELNDEIPF